MRNAFVWIASVALWTGVTCRVVAPEQGLTASSGLPRGRRCCGGDHALCSDAPSGTAAAFSPPLHYGNLSQASQEIAWSYQPLRCPKGFRETPYDLDGKHNWLIVSEDGVALRWLELVSKETEEYCVTRNPRGGYRAATCRPDTNQVIFLAPLIFLTYYASITTNNFGITHLHHQFTLATVHTDMQRQDLYPEMLRRRGGDVTLPQMCQAPGQRVFPRVSFASRRPSRDSQEPPGHRQGAAL